MNTLIDFLNHGSTPFVGRGDERDRLIELWRATRDAHGLRLALMLGEAGSGKSRLVEETVGEIEREGGVALHVRIYPDAPGSLMGLIADALRSAPVGRGVGGDGVAGSVRRCARLRSTILVVEDIHLLRGDTLREFTGFLDALVDEPLLVLCASRPLDAPARGALESYLTDEMTLAGLAREQIAAMWEQILGTPLAPAALAVLADATLGNPLAIRTALRRTIHPLVGSTRGAGAPLPSVDVLSEGFRHTVELMSEGMTAHLSDEERETASLLATLGEIVSVSTARALLDESGEMLDRLLFKGVMAHATVPTRPLFGGVESDAPLVFTHTLLHRRLLDDGSPDPARLLSLLASGLTLYSVVPFQLLANAITGTTLTEDVLGAVEPVLNAAMALDLTTDWELAPLLWRAAAVLVEAVYGDREDIPAREVRGKVMAVRIGLLRRTDHVEEYAQLVERLLAFSEDPATETLVDHRLVALRYVHWKRRYDGDDVLGEIWEEVERLADLHEGYRFRSISYRAYIRMIAFADWNARGLKLAARAEEHIENLLADPRAGDDLRLYAEEYILPFFLSRIDNAGQLEERRALLRRLDASITSGNIWYQTAKMAFLFDIEDLDGMIAMGERIEPILRALGDRIGQLSLFSSRLHIAIMTGEEIERAIRRFEDELTKLDPATRKRALSVGGINLALGGLLCGEFEAIRSFARRNSDAWEEMSGTRRMLVGLAAASDREKLSEIESDRILRDRFPALIGYANRTGPLEAAVVEGREWLAWEIVRGEDVLLYIALIEFMVTADRIGDSQELTDALRSEIRSALNRLLDWMAERILPLPIRSLLDRFGKLMVRRDREMWRERQGECEARRPLRRAMQRTSLPTLTMFGTVCLRTAEGEEVAIRGGRLRALAGLMVADALLGHTLTWHEFAVLASDGERDTERARRMLTMAVYRLRETIGPALIQTEGETPRLDLSSLRVDLLDAHRALIAAQSAVRDGALLRAVPALESALALAGDVPFPSLYDSFFEAAREDFEHLLRTTLLGVVDALESAGDTADAERLLRRGVVVLPGDEELSERLCALLDGSGRRLEAERLRMIAAA